MSDQKKVVDLADEVVELRAKLAARTEEREVLKEERDKLRKDLDAAHGRGARSDQEVHLSKEAFRAREKWMREQQQKLDQTTRDLEACRASHAERDRDTAELVEEREKLRKDLEGCRASHVERDRELELTTEANSNLGHRIGELMKDLENMEERYSGVRADADQYLKDNARLRSLVELAVATIAKQSILLENVREMYE